MAEAASAAAAEDTNENLETAMNANAWTREEHYHFLKVRASGTAAIAHA